MSVFQTYSRYYDLLYKDKDYQREVDYLTGLLKQHCPTAKKLLDIGCGTGAHDVLLAEAGFEVDGVDLSEEMLIRANEKRIELSPELRKKLAFHHGDARTFRVEKTFDAVLSLFHVMSYQNSNEDLLNAFQTAKAHLIKGGYFIFDCWYGPGVLTDPPATRVKRLEDDSIQVVRIAEPVLHAEENIVDVNYSISIRDKATEQIEEIKETHRMRYLFTPELLLMGKQTGFEFIASLDWMKHTSPGYESWNACFIFRI